MNDDIEVINLEDTDPLDVALSEALRDSEGDSSYEVPENDSGSADNDELEDTEEPQTEEPKKVQLEDKELTFFERKNITRSTPFDPESKDGKESFPIRGRGSIDNILVQSESDTFGLFLRVDDDDIIDNESFTYLNSISQELSHISAYQRTDGDYIVSITDYPFTESVEFSIIPTEETTFTLIRPEVITKGHTQ